MIVPGCGEHMVSAFRLPLQIGVQLIVDCGKEAFMPRVIGCSLSTIFTVKSWRAE